jgi:hypothetical protein
MTARPGPQQIQPAARCPARLRQHYALTELAKSRGETETRDRKDAERLAADAGNPYPLMQITWLQEKAGHYKDAERLARLAADFGRRRRIG